MLSHEIDVSGEGLADLPRPFSDAGELTVQKNAGGLQQVLQSDDRLVGRDL